jgi:AhpD family alkylhydroperoxidase
MTTRLDPYKVAPAAIKPLMGLEAYIKECGLEHSLIHLVKVRASQINGCALCLDMHTAEARKDGESEIRLYMLSGWHESTRFSPRERAALAWTESLTLISQTHAPDDVYEELLKHFTEQEAANLTLAIGAINVWNRIAISFRMLPLSERKQQAA